MGVPEEHLLQHSHGSYDSRLPSGRQSVHLHVRSDERGCEFGVCSCSGTAASDGFTDVVDLNRDDKLDVQLEDSEVGMRGLRTFSQFLSATMGPVVARVSAPRTTPSLNMQPTMVVPVEVALGRGIPRS